MKFYLIKKIFKKLIIMPVLLIIFSSPSWALKGPSHVQRGNYIAGTSGSAFSLMVIAAVAWGV